MKGFRVGDRIDCSLTGVPGREGLWHALYPGTVVNVLSDSEYVVALDNYIRRLAITQDRLFHQRNDVCTIMPNVGDMVHVLEYDKEVPVWWEAKVLQTWRVASADAIKVEWQHTWKGHPQCQWVSFDRVRPAQEPRIEPEPILLCKDCKERPCFGQNKLCGSCFVEAKVDGILYVLNERAKSCKQQLPPRYHWTHRQMGLTRALIVQQGGQNAKRDARLRKKLYELVKRLDQMLPKEWK